MRYSGVKDFIENKMGSNLKRVSWNYRVVVVILVGNILVSSCAQQTLPASIPAPLPAPAPESSTKLPSPPPTPKPILEPVLLEELSRNCQPAESKDDFQDVGLSIGQRAVNFTLKDTQGAEFRLSQLLVEMPVVMIFGSFT